MRPVRLVVEGFTSFRERTEVDFTGADYFALVGPTGAGKSSVLDAICFALYGKVPRYDHGKLVAPVITQGAQQATVSLTFELAGDEYVATRVVQRTKQGAETKEARLEHGGEVLAGDVTPMNAAVEGLIGLPFEHFTRCVVLPQGEFARFLHDAPSKRQDVLVELLDLGVYERMRAAAGTRAQEGENAVALDEQRLAGLADCTPEAEAAAREALARVQALREELAEGEQQIRELERAVAQATEQAEAARAVVEHLRAVEVPAEVRTLGERRAEAVATLEQAEAARAAAEEELTEHRRAMAGLPDPVPLREQLAAYADLERLEGEIEALRTNEREAQSVLDAARGALEQAEQARAAADAAYDAAVERTLAAELAARLTVGEPCPVCEQIVTRTPEVHVGEKAAAQQARDDAREAEREAGRRVNEAQREMDRLAGQIERTEARRQELRDKVAAAPPAADLEQTLAHIDAAHTRRDELQQRLLDASGAEREASERLTGLDRRLADARAHCDRQREPLVRAGLDVPALRADLVASWEALAAWAAQQVPEHERIATEQAEEADRAAAAVRGATDRLAAQCVAAGVVVSEHPAPTVGALREAAAAAEERASAEVERIVAGVEEAGKLTARIAATKEQVEVARELARLLQANHFEQWVLNEALGFLTEGASAVLEQLSAGQYALEVDDENNFLVVDHRNADERRPVRTLSGGETFQASLALALSLAEHVGTLAASGAAKLDAIFLDEGFGTLDADSLDTVAATLETLGQDGRMVGIVTHVRELAERVPVRYEVAKGPRTSTVTRVDA